MPRSADLSALQAVCWASPYHSRPGGPVAPNPLDPAYFDPTRTSAELRGMVEQLEAAMPRPTSQPRTAEAAQAARREFDESPVFSFAPLVHQLK